MLIGWGLYGWTAFLMKRFMKNSKMVKRMALMAAQGNALIGLALLGLSGWKTASRDKCSVSAGYWQCWYDSSPSTAETWKNGNYSSQSRTAYLLALQMIWLSKSTTKYLSADLKFQDNRKKKQAAKGDAKKDEKKGKKDDKKKGPGPAAQKLSEVAETLAWGL